MVVTRIQRDLCHPGKRIKPVAISRASRDDYDAFDRTRVAPEWRTGRESAPSSTWNISHCDRLLLNRNGQTIEMKRMTKAAIAGTMLTNAQVSSGQRQGQGSGTEQPRRLGIQANKQRFTMPWSLGCGLVDLGSSRNQGRRSKHNDQNDAW